MLIVQKFGGSSLAGLERMHRSAQIVKSAAEKGEQPVVVVSAMGGRTDTLLSIAQEIDPHPDKREWDALLCTGEQHSAALMAMMLRRMGLPARSMTGWQSGIYTDNRHTDADIIHICPQRLQQTLQQGLLPVITGFQGVSPEGDLTTLGRGGSDTSAVALAAALAADRCCIYSDVAGVYTADPRLIRDALPVPEMDFRDMLMLSRAGSQLLHTKSAALALDKNIELELRSSFGEVGMSRVCRLPEEIRPGYAGITRDVGRSRITLVGKACCLQTAQRMSSLLLSRDYPVSDNGFGEGFAWVEVNPSRLTPALSLIHREYFL